MAAFYSDLCSKYPIISIEVRVGNSGEAFGRFGELQGRVRALPGAPCALCPPRGGGRAAERAAACRAATRCACRAGLPTAPRPRPPPASQDPFNEDDWDSYTAFTSKGLAQIVGDDLLCEPPLLARIAALHIPQRCTYYNEWGAGGTWLPGFARACGAALHAACCCCCTPLCARLHSSGAGTVLVEPGFWLAALTRAPPRTLPPPAGTNPKRVQKAIDTKACNALLLKVGGAQPPPAACGWGHATAAVACWRGLPSVMACHTRSRAVEAAWGLLRQVACDSMQTNAPPPLPPPLVPPTSALCVCAGQPDWQPDRVDPGGQDEQGCGLGRDDLPPVRALAALG